MKKRLRNPIHIFLILFAIFVFYVTIFSIDLQFYSAILVHSVIYGIRFLAPFISLITLIIIFAAAWILRNRAASSIRTLDTDDLTFVLAVKCRLRKAAILVLSGNIINLVMFFIFLPDSLNHGITYFAFAFAVYAIGWFSAKKISQSIRLLQKTFIAPPPEGTSFDMTQWPFDFSSREQNDIGGAAYLAINSFNRLCTFLLILLSLIDLLCGGTLGASPMLMLGVLSLSINVLFCYHRAKIEK